MWVRLCDTQPLLRQTYEHIPRTLGFNLRHTENPMDSDAVLFPGGVHLVRHRFIRDD